MTCNSSKYYYIIVFVIDSGVFLCLLKKRLMAGIYVLSVPIDWNVEEECDLISFIIDLLPDQSFYLSFQRRCPHLV